MQCSKFGKDSAPLSAGTSGVVVKQDWANISRDEPDQFIEATHPEF
jgi:hypothetical protein